MNKKAFLPLLLLLAIGVFFSFRMVADKKGDILLQSENIQVEPYAVPDGENTTRNQAIQNTIMNVIRDGHYSPKMLNDEFSKKVYERYLEMTDYGKSFLLQSDLDEFSAYETSIDDELNAGTTKFAELVAARIATRITEAEAYYKDILNQTFTFTAEDEIELDGKKLNWCANADALKERWTKSMKYRTLARFTELKEEQKKAIEAKTLKDKKLSDSELEVKARENVRKSMDNYFKRLKKINEHDRFAYYMNSVCHIVDPHTDFFPPKDKQRFDEEMSGKFYGIGAQLQSDGDHCKIKQVIVGTPAWKDGRLKVEDIIQKVAQGAEEPVDITGWDIEDIVQIIRGKEGTEVRLTVKHLDGSMDVISLRRGKVETEATFAKSAILKNGGSTIGYIMLPEFYADFGDINGRRCAVDMAREIEKLKKENVQGIIVDLRGNGGGSLSDVVDIGGLFVDKGPMVQVKSKEAQAQELATRTAKALYDGPLVIMVNQGSASASEILAAAMQDYKRAIVMGANSFGKGTVQKVFPLEDFFRGNPESLASNSSTPAPSGMGSIKLTLQKFYRINGGSTQLRGVTPDIVMPDMYDFLDIGERKDSNSLAWDQIAKADYKPIKDQVNFTTLVLNSQKRIASNERFNLISKNAERLKKQSDDNRYSLNENKFKAQLDENKDLAKKMEELEKNAKQINAGNLIADKPNVEKDTTTIAKNTEWLKLIKKDPYIAEASNVINDWLKLMKSGSLGKVNEGNSKE
jgi:carboxyl-terminal processing protease